MLNDMKSALFLFLQAKREVCWTIVIAEDLNSLAGKNEHTVSYVSHRTVWDVKRGNCPIISFRTELASKIFAFGYSLDLATAIDGIPENRQKMFTEIFKCKKLTDLKLSWDVSEPEQKKENIISGKFK